MDIIPSKKHPSDVFKIRVLSGLRKFALLVVFLLVFFKSSSEAKITYGQYVSYVQYLPFVSHSDFIKQYVNSFNLDNITFYTSYLVTQFGPEHPNYYKPYIDDRCTPGSTGYPKNNLSRGLKYAFTELKNLGYNLDKEWIPVYLDGSAYTVYNIVAEKTGSLYPEKIIEIGAHIDNYTGTPGASDNAGSVGAILEMARLLKDYSSRYTLHFVIYVGEEYGLIGSRYHVKLLRDRNSQVKASLVMDGTGWSEIAPLKMNCLWDNGDPVTRKISELFDQARQQYQIDIGWRLCSPTIQVSDNLAYWEKGYPSVLSIGGLPYTDPNYHKCSDTMNSVDLQNVYLTAQENLAVLLRLDSDDTLIDTTQFQNLYTPSESNPSH